MLSSHYERHVPNEIDHTFPCLLESVDEKYPYVVLFSGYKTGTVVWAHPDCDYLVGTYKHDWSPVVYAHRWNKVFGRVILGLQQDED